MEIEKLTFIKHENLSKEEIINNLRCLCRVAYIERHAPANLTTMYEPSVDETALFMYKEILKFFKKENNDIGGVNHSTLFEE
ncbi:MAG: hypothetical protein SPL83_02055 [Succinivibrio sp.]|nr:hypothetical protein [Succinivibrio sp.]